MVGSIQIFINGIDREKFPVNIVSIGHVGTVTVKQIIHM